MGMMNDFMKDAARKFIFGILIIMAMSSLAGCQSLDGDMSRGAGEGGIIVHHAAIIVGNTKYEPVFDISSLQESIKAAASVPGSTYLIINADGDPSQVDKLTIPAFKKGISESKRQQKIEEYVMQIMGVVSNVQPDDDEMNLLKAINQAARDLQQYEGRKEMYIVSSGLSTTDLVNFTELGLQNDYSGELVKALDGQLPDMSGIAVYWEGLGETCGEQTDLYESDRAVLKNVWTSLLKAAGVETIEYSSAIARDTEVQKTDVPYVSLVPIIQPVTEVKAADLEKGKDAGEKDVSAGKVLNLSEKISFKADSSELLTGVRDVKNSLGEMISYLKDDRSRTILLVGTTASCGKEDSLQQLSLKRCQVIRRILVDAGVKKKQVVCAGAGYMEAYKQKLTCMDTDNDGNLIESAAAKNRSVYCYTNIKMKKAQAVMKYSLTDA